MSGRSGGHSRQVPDVALYLVALALSGCAALVSVALPAAERGVLAAVIVGATLGAGLGGLSVDTFLLSRPAGWVAGRGGWWLTRLVAACVALSAAAAAAVTAVAGVGGYPVAMCGAGALTLLNTGAALALRRERFTLVYGLRAAGGAALVGGYALLYLSGNRDGTRWSVLWLAAQALVAAVLGAWVLARARAFTNAAQRRVGHRADLTAQAKLHAGICAQMLTYRLDQVLLARFAGAGALGVYALAVTAVEFAQGGAVVAAQKILANRDPAGRDPRSRPERVARVVGTALAVALPCVGALAVVGLLVPGYAGAWLLGLLLVPGCLAVSAGKAWSAMLLKRRGEPATTKVALVTLAVSGPAYLAIVPWAGAVGAAVTSSLGYAVHAAGSRLGLRRGAADHRPEPRLLHRAA